jgi:hypothetical protein
MRSYFVLVAFCALVGCDSLSHPFDDPNPPTLPNVSDYDRSCNVDSDCTAVNAGDCCGGQPTGINVKDAARFEMDFTKAESGEACQFHGGDVPLCDPVQQEGTITPTCVQSAHQCVAVFCDSTGNNCVTN